MNIIIIGGGIIGLSSAYYLQQSGHQVTVIDKGDMEDGCSYGNAGYVCPSHFVPMATPGIVKQGLKWMLNAKSPFYVQPSLSWSLVDWGMKFIRSANMKHVDSSAIPLRDISALSQQLYVEWSNLPIFNFSYQHKGLLEIFQTEEAAHHAEGSVEKARQLGIDVELLDYNQLQQLESQKIDALGAIYFKCDAHLNPNQLMRDLKDHLRAQGVKFILNEEVTGFAKKGNKIAAVVTPQGRYETEQVIVATGSWSRHLAAKLDLKLPLMPGRGYSVTLDNPGFSFNHPAILIERRVAVTPISETRVRFGGTMEITSTKTPPKWKRVEGIIDSVKHYFPEVNISIKKEDAIWYGYRPCSADGLPYIGRLSKFSNCILATGHSMVGLSLGAGTGKLVAELANGAQTSIDISAFDPERFD